MPELIIFVYQMKSSEIPHYFNIFPTGKIIVPVCIGDLPMSDYLISEDTLTEEVAAYLDSNPLVPGAIILHDGRVKSIVPRHKMFERLGRRYGVELFLRRPILKLEQDLGTDAFVLKSHLSINMAVKLALSRVQTRIYDPIIVEFETGELRLLDMYVLLLSQSQLSQNLSGIITSLNNIEMMLSSEQGRFSTTLELILEGMESVVPTHNTHIILNLEEDGSVFAHPSIRYQERLAEHNSIFNSVISLNQPIVLEDVNLVPGWPSRDFPPKTRCWLGAPVISRSGPVGVLSLSRTAFSPFTSHEKETTLVFARYVGKLIENFVDELEKRKLFDRKYSTGG